MAETLVIRLCQPGSDSTEWCIVDHQGNRVGTPGTGSLGECAAQAQHRNTVVLVPGEEVALLDADIPTRKRQRILQAAPWVLEEHLAEDVERLHFAIGPRQADERIRIGVVAKTPLQTIVDQLHRAEITPDALLPDFLAVPPEPEGWSLFIDGDRVLARTGDCDGFTADQSTAPDLLEALLPDIAGESPTIVDEASDESDEPASAESRTPEGMPGRIRLIRPASENAFAQQLNKRFSAHGIEVDDRPYDGTAAAALTPDLGNTRQLDLAQGEFRVKREEDSWWWPWRPALALTAGLLLVLAVAEVVHMQQLAREARHLEQRMDEVFLAALPDAQTTRDARRRMEQRLQGLREGGAEAGFLPVMKATTEGLSGAGGGQLDSLSYRPGVLDISLRVDSRGDLDRFRDAVEASGPFSVDIRSAQSDNDHIRGRVEIRDRDQEN